MQATDPNQAKQVQVFKTLADPTRLGILKLLKHADREMTCGEVDKIMAIGKTSGSYHFKLLQDAGLINVRKVAREKYVSINPQAFDQSVTDFYKNL